MFHEGRFCPFCRREIDEVDDQSVIVVTLVWRASSSKEMLMS